jgi:hypothetical protein
MVSNVLERSSKVKGELRTKKAAPKGTASTPGLTADWLLGLVLPPRLSSALGDL